LVNPAIFKIFAAMSLPIFFKQIAENAANHQAGSNGLPLANNFTPARSSVLGRVATQTKCIC
jgi:hypothetical protein